MSRAALLTVLTLTWAGHAQARSSTAVERARRLHEEGVAALEELRFAQARDAFRQALTSTPTRGIAFNLGLALRGTGELREAIAIWERLIDGEFGPLDAELEGQVRALVEEIRAGLARVEIALDGPERAELLVDGEPRGELLLRQPTTLELDPGRRILAARAEGYRMASQSLELSPGSSARLVLQPVALPSSESWAESPILWTIVGLAAAIGLGLGLYFGTGPHFEAPYREPPFAVIVTLSSR